MSNVSDNPIVDAEVTGSVDRAEIMRRFERWLDRTLSREDPPEGIDAELLAILTADDSDSDGASDAHTDSFALWSAVTALTQEVKLQGRTFKELHRAIGAEAARTAEEVRAGGREREREVQREAEHRCRREILNALLDLRDSLVRGRESVRAVGSNVMKRSRHGWLTRMFQSSNRSRDDTISALVNGYELGLDRLDQMLTDLNVREIVCDGRPFDARRMNAIDRKPSPDVPEGTVLEVYRSGYEWNGEVFRTAHVKVSCHD
jgi:molecular chaperone GrpE